jgi:hypothetical protein
MPLGKASRSVQHNTQKVYVRTISVKALENRLDVEFFPTFLLLLPPRNLLDDLRVKLSHDLLRQAARLCFPMLAHVLAIRNRQLGPQLFLLLLPPQPVHNIHAGIQMQAWREPSTNFLCTTTHSFNVDSNLWLYLSTGFVPEDPDRATPVAYKCERVCLLGSLPTIGGLCRWELCNGCVCSRGASGCFQTGALCTWPAALQSDGLSQSSQIAAVETQWRACATAACLRGPCLQHDHVCVRSQSLGLTARQMGGVDAAGRGHPASRDRRAATVGPSQCSQTCVSSNKRVEKRSRRERFSHSNKQLTCSSLSTVCACLRASCSAAAVFASACVTALAAMIRAASLSAALR